MMKIISPYTKQKALFFLEAITAVVLLFFSYTQVDLNLTLSRAGFVQSIEKSFQFIGYYQRPFATSVYIIIISLLFILYICTLQCIRSGILQRSTVWKMIYFLVAVLVLSYPAAFSYDFFNYLFTAKTIIVYHQNPYIVLPLQFSGIDPWTNFMRWTHLPSAYAPIWLLLSLIPYLAGFGYFLMVLFMTKCMIAGFFLVSCWAIDKITNKTESLALFALNPLILIESLVSAHNDIVLVAFVLLAIWYLENKKYISSWFYLSLSIAVKLMTIFLIPIFMFKKNRFWMLAAMVAGLSIVILRREFLPWYFVWIIPFVAIVSEKKWIAPLATAVSLGLLLSYTPYFYYGNYNTPVPLLKTILTWTPILCIMLYFSYNKFIRTNV
jgi:hypothetical protein